MSEEINNKYLQIITQFNSLPWEERIVLLKLLKQHHKDALKNPVILNED
tara:strand:+ start:460 stop:606 length:147 start_codon:yes stop_codon:yes gene_type:complete